MPNVIASSEGKLMVIPHVKAMAHGGTRQYGGKPIVGQWDGARFIAVYHGKSYKVARLVCEAFHGAPPFPRAVCMHLDENSRNNRPNNLRWGTQKENLNAPGFLEYCRGRTGKDNPFTKGRRARAAS